MNKLFKAIGITKTATTTTSKLMSPTSTTATAATVSPTLKVEQGDEIFTIAAGCFWGVEHIYRKHFGTKVHDMKVGYANGHKEEPTYREVCTGNTNHAEALQISFDPAKVSFKDLVRFFFLMHDPTTLNSQGPDVGTQYRSGVFTTDESQTETAKEVKEEIQKSFYPNHTIVTTIEPIKNFWDAEDYHQLYLQKNPTGYECPSHFVRTSPKI